MSTEEMDAAEVQRQKAQYSAVAADPAKPRFALVETRPLAEGVLDIVRWEGDRMLRVWKPKEFHLESDRSQDQGSRRYPALYLNDGQNLFDDRLSFSGHSMRAAEAASALIVSKKVPPFVIVGIDNGGALRSYEYTPYKPGTGPMGTRKDAAMWPGGGVYEYLERVIREILPWATKTYNLSSDPEKVAFGGSSFGGICALACALRYPEVFGSILVESPSLWLANEKFLNQDIAGYSGPWPERTFLAMGTKEYTFTRPHDPQPEFDKLLATYVPKLETILERNGVFGKERVLAVVEEGAGHTESAWARRLPQALDFLLSPWLDKRS